MSTEPWKRVQPTIVRTVGHRTIVSKTFVMPDGSRSEFETYDSEGRQYVAVIALTPDGQVIVARQFRAGPERVMDEIPGGGVETGESLETAARRELLEETGYRAGQMRYLGAVCKDEKFNAQHHYFMAYDCQPTGDAPQLDQDEHIETIVLPLADFMQTAQRGGMTDTLAVLLAYEELQALLLNQGKA